MAVNEPRIWCPKCHWRPRAADRWYCTPGCNTSWNTFWTAGLCPGCSNRWQNTQCLACTQLSPHRDWYHWPDELDESHERRDSSDIPAQM